MPNFSCDKCGKEFTQKSHYTQHTKRKNPCIQEDKLKQIIIKIIDESKNTVNDTNVTTTITTSNNIHVNNEKVNYHIKTMRYLGNKSKHLEFIYSAFNECFVLLNNTNPIIFDAFGGTGTVSQFLNINNHHVVSNDMTNFSYKLCFCRNSITEKDIGFNGLNMNIEEVVSVLNNCKHKGFVYKNYSPNVEYSFERKYFTNSNAEIIDGIRIQIEEWYTNKQITLNEHTFLVALLIESVSLYSNIPGTYGAFNTNWDTRSTRTFMMDKKMVSNLLAKNKYQCYNDDVRNLISEIACDVLYLDPPYNERDYSMYYHVLETISLYNNPEINSNKTGTKKEYKKSKWCMKKECIKELEYIIKNTNAKCVVMSYNNEGIMKIEEIEGLFKMYGTYSVKTKTVKRFKCNDTNDNVIVNEYLHVLIKNDCQKSVAVIDDDNGLENTVVGVCKQYNIIDSSNDTEQNDCDDVAMEVETDVLKNNEMIGGNKIYNRCCIEGMRELPNKIIDLVCVDLPYGLTECKWDTPIDLDDLWKQYKRILKPYGTIILFGQQPFTSRLVSSNYDMFKYSLVWQKSKPGGFAQAPYKVLCEHEDILIFSYGKTAENAKNKMVYNPQGTIPCNKVMKGKTGKTEHRENRKTQKDYIQTTSNYPRSILTFNNEGKTQHPTQKPLELIKYLVHTFSNKNDIVLDSCMGSGTTAIACLETNRQYIGYELEKKYFDVATERIINTNTNTAK